MTQSPNLKFLSHNAILKNAILALAEYGEVTVDLVIKNVVMVTLDDNEKPDSYYQISCQFKFRNLDNKKRIEKVLLDLIMEAKRKRESEPLDSILLYTDDNIIGQAIHDYMIERARRITTLTFRILSKVSAPHRPRRSLSISFTKISLRPPRSHYSTLYESA